MSGHGADVVVIGAGAAGCVLARRLADAGRSTLLLEAGPDLLTAGGADLRDGWRLPKTSDWGYQSEPDRNGVSATLRRVKGIGGTGWMTRFAVRGSSIDFDRWAAATDPGWSFESVLPIFRSIETDEQFGDRPWHGDRGPIPITRYPTEGLVPVHAATVEAATRHGFDWVADHNEPGETGIGPMPMSSHAGIRVTSADGYLLREVIPDRLTVRPDAQVATVTTRAGRATGVRLVDGEQIEADTVVLAAGTYGSPTILLRSGIGPAADLQDLGITVVADVPGVGRGLADHPALDLVSGWQGATPTTPTMHTIATFRADGTPLDEPQDLMFWIADPAGDPPSFEISIVLLRPRSRGQVRLRSIDPMDPPRIELPDLREPTDVRRLADGFRRASAIADDRAVRALCPDPATPMPATDAALEAYVLDNAYSVPHVVGTCAMGRAPSTGAVVDGDGRVHGVDRLFVADASIMPEPPSGFPHLVILMLAEAIAARISR